MRAPNLRYERAVGTLRLGTCVVDLDTGALSGGRDGRLTTRERELLAYLVARSGTSVPRDEVLTVVFGYAPTAASRAVDKAMNSLRAKVEADPGAPRHLLTVHGTGYRFEP